MNNYSARRRVGIVGARGYAGTELFQILSRHPCVEVLLLEHRSDPEPRPGPLGQTPPQTLSATPESITEESVELVFLASPPEVSIELAGPILATGAKMIDLSGAFRLRDAETYSRWYRERHSAPDLLAQAVYGLPEFYREQIRDASLIANPGCYPTAANLALKPLIDAQVVDRGRGIICDAKSGVSGAGRRSTSKTSFCEVSGNLTAYSIIEHRHVPEVLENTGLGEREFTFTAHLLPVERGILETIYIRTLRAEKAVDLLSIYEDYYADEPFVRLYAPGKVPDLRSVQHTNFCDLGFVFDRDSQRAVVVACLDNLGKGAAGQAVQNMNLMLGFPEAQSLL